MRGRRSREPTAFASPGRRLFGILLPVLSWVSVGGCATVLHRIVARTDRCPPYHVSEEAARLHQTIPVVDLHADALLWSRDLLERSDHGHVDLPRLREGGVALQVFGVVTQVPLFFGMDCNSGTPDALGALAWMQCWPRCTHASQFQRAVHQARKLDAFARRSAGALRVIRTRDDLRRLLEARRGGDAVVGGMLALEGAHALEGRLANLQHLYDHGFRMLGLSHFFDTDVAGSAHGKVKGGLTAFGARVVRRAQSLGMIIDLAHASPKAIDDVVAVAKGPVVASHGGVRATCDSVRNLADLVGVEHVALGSDFDGASTFIDVSGVPLVTEALLAVRRGQVLLSTTGDRAASWGAQQVTRGGQKYLTPLSYAARPRCAQVSALSGRKKAM